jgi:hypothetical protein
MNEEQAVPSPRPYTRRPFVKMRKKIFNFGFLKSTEMHRSFQHSIALRRNIQTKKKGEAALSKKSY